MKKYYKILLMVSIVVLLIVVGLCVIRQMSKTVEISLYCKSTKNVDVILYADNCSDAYPFGSGGACIPLTLTSSNQICKINYKISKGTENKIRFDFKSSERADIFVSGIEISYPNFKKTLSPEKIVELFGEVDKSNLNDQGILFMRNVQGIKTISCMNYSEIRKTFSPDWLFCLRCIVKILVITLLLVGCGYIAYIAYFKQDRIYHKKYSKSIIIFLASVTITCISLLFEMKSLGSYESNGISFKVFLWNVIIVWCIMSLISCISNFKIGIFLTSIITIIFECINYFKVVLRQENFLPWDIKIAKEAMDVTNLLELPWSVWMFLLAGEGVILCIYLYPLHLNKFKKEGLRRRLFSACILIGACVLVQKQIGVNNIFHINQLYISSAYADTGLFICFLHYSQNVGVIKPAGYEQNAIMDIVKEAEEKNEGRRKEDKVEPNIIMIMSESFWNPEILTDISYNEHFMEKYKEISMKACSGKVLAPVFGGGTANAEFEALTGFSMEYIQNGLMPYIGVIQDDFFSVARYLNGKGYYTTAMHPNDGAFYRRDKAYDLLGFDKTIFGNEFYRDAVRAGWCISDDSVVDKIIETYTENREINNRPQFIFTVTIQNHYPYGVDNTLVNDESLFNFKNLEEETVKGLRDFSAGINASSDALGKLIDYFADCDEPTIVIYWGDHMSSVGKGYDLAYEAGYLKENDNTDYFMYLTPIVVWDNFVALNEPLKVRSTFQILPTVFSMYELEMPGYFEFLNNIQKYSLGISHHTTILDSEGLVASGEDRQLGRVYHQLELLQYDYIYGKRYAKALFGS